MKKTIKIELDIDFIKKAHTAACAEWKRILEDKFPEILFTNNKIKKLPSYINLINEVGDSSVQFLGNNELLVFFPHSNQLWSKYTLDLVNDLIAEGYSLYHSEYVTKAKEKISDYKELDAILFKK